MCRAEIVESHKQTVWKKYINNIKDGVELQLEVQLSAQFDSRLHSSQNQLCLFQMCKLGIFNMRTFYNLGYYTASKTT